MTRPVSSASKEFLCWQMGASAHVRGLGTDSNPYPPSSGSGAAWLAGWRAWGEHVGHVGVAVGPRFRFGLLWWNQSWYWRECLFEPGLAQEPMSIRDIRPPPDEDSLDMVLKRLAIERHLRGLDQEAIAVLRKEGGANMKLTLVLAMMTVLFGCATTNQRGLSDAWKPQRSPLRFPRLGEARRDMVSGPMARAVAVAGMETRRYVEERHLPACFGTPDGTDFLVSDAEVTLDGSKKSTRVFYVMAIPNPQRCKVPEDVAFDLEGLDYIINERGELLKAARIQHSP